MVQWQKQSPSLGREHVNVKIIFTKTNYSILHTDDVHLHHQKVVGIQQPHFR